MTESSTSKVHDELLGEINVWREYKPRTDEIEYTVYFYRNDVRCRCDFSVKASEIAEHPNPESFVQNQLYATIDRGEYISLEAVQKMREVPKDDKWIHEREANDARRDAYEVTGEADTGGTEEGFSAGMDALEGQLAVASQAPSETELIIVALLMRLYDVNMALLSHFDKQTADNIYDTHANGGTFNPAVFIPTISDANTKDDSGPEA